MRFVLVFCWFFIFSSVAINSVKAGQEKPSLLALSVGEFDFTGSAEDAFALIALECRPHGVFGFQRASGRSPKVSLSARHGATVSELLHSICIQDPRFIVVSTTDPRVINIVAGRKERRGVLEIGLARFDFAVDDWPQNWFLHVPEFSTKIDKYLIHLYGLSPHQSGMGTPGSHLSSDIAPPHMEVHLRNVTVREVLNQLSIHSMELVAGREGIIPKGVQLYPVGWEYSVPNSARVSLNAWMRFVFSVFPPN